ncbi:MAG: RNA polymerase sigma factor [Steroidobacteraceae bacterium]|nr:RNA polymerase sigma factor [Steroidobacteraceae bacterium]
MTRSATLPAPAARCAGRSAIREAALDTERALERFLAGIERRAFGIARLALGDHAEAEDAVQDAMIRLVRNYAGRPAEQWRPLFYRILRNRITDSQRRRKVRRAVIAWWPGGDGDGDAPDPVDSAADPGGGPDAALEGEEFLARIQRVLAGLSSRQREAFMLRNFEGMDVAQTAIAMGCSEGSVKTHYFRALQALQEVLGEWKT